MLTEKKGESPDLFVIRGIVIVIVSMCVINSLPIPLAQQDGKVNFLIEKVSSNFYPSLNHRIRKLKDFLVNRQFCVCTRRGAFYIIVVADL